MKTNTTFPLLLLLLFSLSCHDKEEIATPLPPSTIQYFGFTLIDTYWDDPTDSDPKTNYADEVYPFSNVADILVVGPTDNIVQKMQAMAALDMQAILHLSEFFFTPVGTDSPSGVDYALRPDFRERWEEFVSTNQLFSHQDMVNAFYMGEEPTWNGISFEDLKTATEYVKNQFPDIPIMIIEAYPILDNLQVPETVDWIGFDHYFVKNPTTDADFQQEWNTIKSKRSTPQQKLVVVMDSHYISWAHGDFGHIELEEMKEVATHYYELAKSDTSVIAMLGYFWPNGFDVPESIGARSMPQQVKQEYVRIGKEITGKE